MVVLALTSILLAKGSNTNKEVAYGQCLEPHAWIGQVPTAYPPSTYFRYFRRNTKELVNVAIDFRRGNRLARFVRNNGGPAELEGCFLGGTACGGTKKAEADTPMGHEGRGVPLLGGPCGRTARGVTTGGDHAM